MQNKELVDLENNKMLRSENIEYNSDSLKNTLDKIIESGNNDVGEYVKYENGRLVTAHKVTRNLSRTSAWGNMYETNEQADLGNFPMTFKEIPYIFLTLYGQNALFESVAEASKTSAGKVYLLAPTANSSSDYTIQVLAVGKWK